MLVTLRQQNTSLSAAPRLASHLVCRLLVSTNVACRAFGAHMMWAAESTISWARLSWHQCLLEPLLKPSHLELLCGTAGLVCSGVFSCKFAAVWVLMLGRLIRETDSSYGKEESRDTSVGSREVAAFQLSLIWEWCWTVSWTLYPWPMTSFGCGLDRGL